MTVLMPGSSATAAKHLLRTTILWRGMSYVFIALPMITSEAPLEYVLAYCSGQYRQIPHPARFGELPVSHCV